MTTTLIECPSCHDHVKTDGASATCSSCGAALGGSGIAPHMALNGGSLDRLQARFEEPVEPEEELRPQPTPAPTGFRGIGLASAGAAVGALLWAGVSYMMHLEIGYLAWGIGGLVGGACVLGKGRGQPVAIACAVLTLVAIFAGKILGMQLILSDATEQVRAMLTREMYEEARIDAAGFAALSVPPTKEEVRIYIADRGYGDVGASDSVTDEDVEIFHAEWAPELRAFNQRQPSFEQWQDDALAALGDEEAATSMVMDELSAIDLIFALLGVTTAFGLVMSATRRDGLA